MVVPKLSTLGYEDWGSAGYQMSGWVREVDAYFSFAAGVALASGVCHAFSQGLKELHMNPRIEICKVSQHYVLQMDWDCRRDSLGTKFELLCG